MGMVMGMIKVPGILQTLKLSNYWADSLQIKFIETVLACRCATFWSFAHTCIMDMPMPMGMITQTAKLTTSPKPQASENSFSLVKICDGLVKFKHSYRETWVWNLDSG